MSLLNRLEARASGQLRRRVRSGRTLVSFDEEHGEDFFIRKVRAMDTTPERNRAGAGYIHGSSLIGMCERHEVLSALATRGEGGALDKSPFAADRICWALGRAAEHHVRTQFITARKREGVLAKWVCKCGHTHSEGLYNAQIKCPRCRGKAKNFEELALWDHDYKIVGNPDMLFIRPDNFKVRPVEIKSMNAKDYGQLVTPLPDHVLQVFINHKLAEVEGMDVDAGVTLIYVCKDYRMRAAKTDANQQGGPYREFHVTPTDSINELLDTLWDRAASIRDWREAHAQGEVAPLPCRMGACSDVKATKAKNCDRVAPCFARP